MTAPTDVTPALKMYGKMLTFTRIQLQTADLQQIETYLAENLSNKNSQIPVIIDSQIEQDLDALIDLFWSWGLQPIGVVTGILDDDAKALRLAIFPGDGKRIERIRPTKKTTSTVAEAIPDPKPTDTDSVAESTTSADVKADTVTDTKPDAVESETATSLVKDTDNVGADESVAASTETSAPEEQALLSQSSSDFSDSDVMTTLFYDQMLRSGQSLNHVGGDLVLTDSVNNGAEAITDNSLHVYGRAQGRLVAGATGDKDARIFCQRFNPSLVSVAGTYCLHDSIPKEVIDKPVQVRFVESEGLVFEILDNK